MSKSTASSIADGSSRDAGRRVFAIVLACAAIAGIFAAWHVARDGLTLSHYDARAHLVVARRVIDSLTPGWRQFGALWLPLPHLLNAIPVQWDAAYRYGITAVAISIGALSWGLAALAQRTYQRTGSWIVAVVPSAMILLSPDLFYLAGTPLTEPLLFGVALASLASVDRWLETPGDRSRSRAGWWLAALVMTRYEGWLVAAGLVVVAGLANPTRDWRDVARLVRPSAITLVTFLGLGYASTGEWILSSSFYVPDPETFHQPGKVLDLILEGWQLLAGPIVLAVAAAGALVALWQSRARIAALLPLSLLLAGLLPFTAFNAGHPFRIRYLVALVVAGGVLAGVAVAALPRRFRAAGAIVVLAIALWTRPPLSAAPPVLTESQTDASLRIERERVSAYLKEHYDGTPILASMSSLAHYMHESSAIGLRLRNFVHEGNGDLWLEAVRSPRRSVRWVLIEEQAEGGDALAALARKDSRWLEGFARVADGGGMALYRNDLGSRFRA